MASSHFQRLHCFHDRSPAMNCEAGHQGQSTNLYGYRFLSNKAKCLFNLVPHLLSREIERPFRNSVFTKVHCHRLGRLQVHVWTTALPECAKKHYKAVKEQSWKIIFVERYIRPNSSVEEKGQNFVLVKSWWNQFTSQEENIFKYWKEAFYIFTSVGIVRQACIWS